MTTLRFTEGIEAWGFNVSRVIRRKNEENLWTSWQRSYGLERVSQAGELVGVDEIKHRRLYEVKPYVTEDGECNFQFLLVTFRLDVTSTIQRAA